MRNRIWASLKTPDARSERHWVLVYKGKYYSLPIRYTCASRFWMKIEDWLERKGFLMVGW